MKKILEYEIVDHGVEHEQYFQGCGVVFTKFDDVATGLGNSPREALENALEDLIQCGYEISEDLENEVKVSSDVDEVALVRNQHRPEPQWIVRLDNYAGMNIPLAEGTKEECEQVFQDAIKRAEKRGQDCVELDEQTYELCEPENVGMVPDYAGILKLIWINEEECAQYDEADHGLNYYVSLRVKAGTE